MHASCGEESLSSRASEIATSRSSGSLSPEAAVFGILTLQGFPVVDPMETYSRRSGIIYRLNSLGNGTVRGTAASENTGDTAATQAAGTTKLNFNRQMEYGLMTRL